MKKFLIVIACILFCFTCAYGFGLIVGGGGATGSSVYYSVRPAGSGSGNDLKVACNITISSGTATLSETQTGDIGVGCCIDYDSDNKIAYISEMTDATHCKVITATGGTPSNVSAVTVNYIYHPFASLSAAVAGSGTLLGFTDLATNTTNLYWPCYGATADTTACTISGYTTSTTYEITVYTPQGGTESINNWRHSGIYSASYYRSQVSGSSNLIVNQANVNLIGIQFYQEPDSYYDRTMVVQANGTGLYVKSSIFTQGTDYNVLGTIAIDAGASATFESCLIYAPDSVTPGKAAYINANTAFNNCTITGWATAVEQKAGTVTATNCAIFNNAYDIGGTVTATYCAGDDADFASGTGNIQWTSGATDWAANFTDYSNGDFSVKDTDADIYHAGTDLDLTYDIAGTAWHATTPSIGAFEYSGS